jgi:hypothetical protein
MPLARQARLGPRACSPWLAADYLTRCLDIERRQVNTSYYVNELGINIKG